VSSGAAEPSALPAEDAAEEAAGAAEEHPATVKIPAARNARYFLFIFFSLSKD
jgi:hypothetical protein